MAGVSLVLFALVTVALIGAVTEVTAWTLLAMVAFVFACTAQAYRWHRTRSDADWGG